MKDAKGNSSTQLAKLTMDLLTHSEKHKVTELKYEEQAGRRWLYFHNWLTRLSLVIKMFSQMAPVFDVDNEIQLFPEPDCVGNRALYMLLCLGDKALKLLKSYCASCTIVDKNHFHHEFTNLQIVNEESATHFLKRFTIARTKAIIANNEYTDDETVDLFLAAVAQTKNVQYLYVIQHYLLERHNTRTISFHDVEWRLLAIDESSERDNFSKRHSKIAFGFATNTVHTDSAATASEKKIICFNCGKPGHKAPACMEPKRQQAHHASSSSLTSC